MTYPLPQPFLVLATQNPIESEGVYPLPEAQRDRFLMRIPVDYPTPAEEHAIVARAARPAATPDRILSIDDVLALQAAAASVTVDPAVQDYAVRLVLATRYPRQHGLDEVEGFLAYGASPRASIGLVHAARAIALIRGRSHALPQDVYDVAYDVMNHRLVHELRRRGRGRDRRRRARGHAHEGHRAPRGHPGVLRVTLPLRKRADPSQVPVSALQLTVLRRLDGLLQGDHAGLLPGHGSDTGEARPYVAGDDPRRIDWAVTARTGDTHVRDTISDHELELWLVVDTSASLAFGTAEHTKAEIAWAAAGAFALLASRRQPCGRRDGGREAHDHPAPQRPQPHRRAARGAAPPRRRRRHRRPRRRPHGRPPVGHPPRDGRGGVRLPRRGTGSCRSALSPPSHDVVAVEVVDQRELELPDVGLLSVVDPETGRRRYVDTGSAKIRTRFAEAAAAQRAAIARHLSGTGADHLVLRTDHDWVVDLVRFVGSRKARRLAAGGRR